MGILPTFAALLCVAIFLWFAFLHFTKRRQFPKEDEKRLSQIREIARRHGHSGEIGVWEKQDSAAYTAMQAELRALQPQPLRVTESISVLLRRQIPPREEDALRSWLGGLPRMPKNVAWPRGIDPVYPDHGLVPLHFIAQICCADLPADLWGGLGPRVGWILLFANINGYHPEDDSWCVLHIIDASEEHAPPSDIRPISSYMSKYAGWGNTETVFPRWPVDMITIPHDQRFTDNSTNAENLQNLLYPSQPVESDWSNQPKLGPFSWRVLLTGLRCAVIFLEDEMKKRDARRSSDRSQTDNLEMGDAARILREWHRWETRMKQRLIELQNEREERPSDISVAETCASIQRHLQEIADERRQFEGHVGKSAKPPEIQAWIEGEEKLYDQWLADTHSSLQLLRTENLTGDLDRPVSADDWAMVAKLSDELSITNWRYQISHQLSPEPRFKSVTREEHSILKIVEPYWEQEAAAYASSYYVNHALRDVLPKAELSKLEAGWRYQGDQRPHRMGGCHDGVQSASETGPQEHVLLLQLAGDGAMNFGWGDCGCLYVFISADALKRGDFGAAEVHVEGH